MKIEQSALITSGEINATVIWLYSLDPKSTTLQGDNFRLTRGARNSISAYGHRGVRCCNEDRY